ncbi:MAG: hypothetical protein ABJE47_17115 [bacterium]
MKKGRNSRSGRQRLIAPVEPRLAGGRKRPGRAVMLGGGALLMALTAFGLFRMSAARKRQAATAIVARPLAVMPFAGVGLDSTQDYLADGISSELVTSLSRNPALRIASRTTAAVLKRQGKSLQQIGAALHARSLIDGTVRRSGSRVSVVTSLYNVADGAQLWKEEVEGDAGNLLTLQADLDARVNAALLNTLRIKAPKSPASPATTDPAAFERYLRGKYLLSRRAEAPTHRAVSLFQEAVSRDTGFARAYGALAVAQMIIAQTTLKPDAAQLTEVTTNGQHALELDSSNPDAHLAMGYILLFRSQDAPLVDPQATQSEQHFKRAVSLEPWRPLAHEWYGELLEKLGRYDDGLDQMKLAQGIDPTSARIASEVANLLFTVRYQAAVQQNMQSSALDTVLALGFKNYSGALAFLHRSDEMVRAFREVLRLDPAFPNARGHMAYALAATNKRADAQKISDELLRDVAVHRTTSYEVAVSRMGLADADGALSWLRRSVDAGEVETGPRRLPCDPYFDPLQIDVRFMEILRKSGARNCPRT